MKCSDRAEEQTTKASVQGKAVASSIHHLFCNWSELLISLVYGSAYPQRQMKPRIFNAWSRVEGSEVRGYCREARQPS